MKQLTKLVLASAVAAAAVVLPAVASAITITSTTPNWSNAVGGSGVVYNGVNGDFVDVRWGTDLGSGQSGLGFDPSNPPSANYAVNTDFLLGTLRHYNNPIAGGSASSSVDLALSTDVSGAVPPTQSFSFRFLIDETPNVTPCAYPSTTPCADRITFQNIDLTSFFQIGGVNYTIVLAGFSDDGGTTVESFFDSQEGGTNSIGLYARITERQEGGAPEPGTLALLGLGLAGLAASRRRKQ